jgi:uncharacterized phosphosugar-binding protein
LEDAADPKQRARRDVRNDAKVFLETESTYKNDLLVILKKSGRATKPVDGNGKLSGVKSRIA